LQLWSTNAFHKICLTYLCNGLLYWEFPVPVDITVILVAESALINAVGYLPILCLSLSRIATPPPLSSHVTVPHLPSLLLPMQCGRSVTEEDRVADSTGS